MLLNLLTPNPDYASNFVEGVDMAFYVILGISAFFLIGITVAMIYFVYKYSREKNPKAGNVQDNMKLEILWTVIPTILVMGMFYYGWTGWKNMENFPKDAMQVEVTGRMWSWQFTYPNKKQVLIATKVEGKPQEKMFVLPVNKPVTLHLYSPDVIHAFYVPAFRVKQDVTPGVKNKMWFTPTKIGEYDLYCAEYCGRDHSGMIGKVKVVSQADFDKWYNAKEVVNKDEHPGYTALKMCIGCHSTDGTKKVGPSFKGLFGSERTVSTKGDEHTLTADKAYIINSIENPNADISKGFKGGMMTSYKGQFTEKQYNDIIDYLKTIK